MIFQKQSGWGTFGNALGKFAKGAIGAIAGSVPLVSNISTLYNAGKSLYTAFKGEQPLNAYSKDVSTNMESNFQQLQGGNTEFNNETMMQSTDPSQSNIGQALLQQNESNVNRQLASSMMSGQASSYDITALQNRATEQGLTGVTGQLQGLAKNASDRYLGMSQYYSGMSPAVIKKGFVENRGIGRN